MNQFSTASKQRLATCHYLIQKLFNEVLQLHDCGIVYGFRTNEEQAKLYEAGKSQLKPGNSLHNREPSLAVDVIPFVKGLGGITGNKARDSYYFYHFAGIVRAVAIQQKTPIRWGGDWDGDGNFFDQSFNDLYHWELPLTYATIPSEA